MPYSIEVKEKAINLRKNGYSLKEISVLFSISKSTASYWLYDIKLDLEAQKRLRQRRLLGQYNASQTTKLKKQKMLDEINQKTEKELEFINFDRTDYRVMASLLYWAEGGKRRDCEIRFANSDPRMVKTFIHFLRKSYDLDELKFRALVHIHEYHNEEEIKQFWSEITNIPLSQFYRSYKKPNTAKRKRDGYKGVLALYYSDRKVARQLKSIYNAIANRI